MFFSGSFNDISGKADTITRKPRAKRRLHAKTGPYGADMVARISPIRKSSMVMVFKIGLWLSIPGLVFWVASFLGGFNKFASLSADAVFLGTLMMMISILGEPEHDKIS